MIAGISAVRPSADNTLGCRDVASGSLLLSCFAAYLLSLAYYGYRNIS
jgi:hypothetical protein